jgi:hypothetical protein
MNELLKMDEMKRQYPGEWMLLGNPEIIRTKVISGIVLFHSKDKKEVCYLGREKTIGFDRVTIAYAGETKKRNKLGILRRIPFALAHQA